jgi:chromosome segregation ATPase
MDRLALELETQTLVRRVDVLTQEKATLEKAVQMYEITLSENEKSNNVIAQLEADLREVRRQLHVAKQDLLSVREQVVAEYKDQLHVNVVKLQRTQKTADTLAQEREQLKEKLEQLQTEFKEARQKFKDDLNKIQGSRQTKEAILTQQLQEVTDLADDLHKQLQTEQELVRQLTEKLRKVTAERDDDIRQLQEELRQERKNTEEIRISQDEYRHKLQESEAQVESLKDHLRQSERVLEATKTAKDDAYEVRISSLEEQLSLESDHRQKMEERNQELANELRDQSKQLNLYKSQCEEQSSLISEMTERLDSVHAEYRDKFGELKDIYETKEKRKLQEMVEAQSGETKEYERRVKALQEQLTYQTDRYQAEIRQKEADLLSKMEAQKASLKREIEIEHGQRLHVVEEKLVMVRQDYEEADAERRRLRKELDALPSKEDTIKERKEREYQDAMHANEIKRLKDRNERLTQEITSKDDKLERLAQQLTETEQSHANKIEELEKRHDKITSQREQAATEQLKAIRSTELRLRGELERREADLEELRVSMEARVSKLRSELDQTFSSLEQTRQIANQHESTMEQLEDTQSTLEQVKKELELERSRREEVESQLRVEIAVLEGKVRAGETSLRQKRDAIEELEEKLTVSTHELAETKSTHQKVVQDLREELQATKVALESESASTNASNKQLKKLQKDYEESTNKLSSQIKELEISLSKALEQEENSTQRIRELEVAAREAKAELISERTRHESVEEQTRVDMAVQVGKLRACEASLKQKREVIEDLEEKLRNIADESSTSNKELQKELDRLREDVKELNKTVDKDRAELFTKSDLLAQHQRRLQENADIILSLQNTVSEKEQAENDAQKSITELKANLQRAETALLAEKERVKEIEAQLLEELSASDAKLGETESLLKAKSDLVEELEKKLRSAEQNTFLSIADNRKKVEQLQGEVLKLKRLLENEKAEVSKKLRQLGELEEESSSLRQRCERVHGLEEALSRAAANEKILVTRVESLQKACAQTKSEAESERTRHESLESQLRSDMAELEGRLQASETTLKSKREMVDNLEKRLHSANQRATSDSDLQSEVNMLRRDLKIATEQLKKERNDFKDKHEQMEQLLQQHREYQSKIRQLEEALAKANDENVDQSFELKRLYDDRFELQKNCSVVRDLEEKLAEAQLAKAELMDKLLDFETDMELKKCQVSRLPILETQLKELLEGREELQAQIGRAEAELERKEQLLQQMKRELATTTARYEAELADSQKAKKAIENELHSVALELEEKAGNSNMIVPELKTQLREQINRNQELEAKIRISEAERSMKRDVPHFSTESLLELRNKIEQLTRTKASLESKIRQLEEDHEEREKQVRESSEKYSNQLVELQMRVEELSKAKASLQLRLSRAQSDLEQKDDLMSVASSQFSGDLSDLKTRLAERIAENEELKSKLETIESELVANQVQTKKTIEESVRDLQTKLDVESKEKRLLRARVGDVEVELERKEKQITDIVSRYSQEIAELQDKLEDQRKSNAAIQRDFDRSRSNLNSLSELEIADLKVRLAASENSLKSERESLQDLKNIRKQIEEELAEQRKANAELQRKIEEASLYAKFSSFAKESDATSELEELAKDNASLQKELDALKREADKARHSLEEQLASEIESKNLLEEEVRFLKISDSSGSGGDVTKKRDLEDKLAEVEKAKIELEEKLKKANAERTEVITALEEVINEVQSREEEIESLAHILRKRDEELEHAKLIATKALASAQEIKARYKGKGVDRNHELHDKMAELNSSVDYLSKKNESLERKTSQLERDLQEREEECAELRKQLKKKSKLDDFMDRGKNNGFHSLNNNGFPDFGTATSPTQAASTLVTATDSMSSSSGWLHDFESHSTDSGEDAASFAGIRTEASSDAKSRGSIERDALRKYVRKRYIKSSSSQK